MAPDPIDDLLVHLEQTLGNNLTLLRIARQLRRNSHHLLQLLHNMLTDLAQEIEAGLPILPSEEGDDDV